MRSITWNRLGAEDPSMNMCTIHVMYGYGMYPDPDQIT